MKITVFNCRPFDELENFRKMEQETGVEIVCCPDAPSLDNIHLAEGSEAITTPCSFLPIVLIIVYL